MGLCKNNLISSQLQILKISPFLKTTHPHHKPSPLPKSRYINLNHNNSIKTLQILFNPTKTQCPQQHLLYHNQLTQKKQYHQHSSLYALLLIRHIVGNSISACCSVLMRVGNFIEKSIATHVQIFQLTGTNPLLPLRVLSPAR